MIYGLPPATVRDIPPERLESPSGNRRPLHAILLTSNLPSSDLPHLTPHLHHSHSRSSGLIYVLVQLIMSVVVLLCWSTTHAEPFIYFLKFMELLALNIWSISSVAITLLIFTIVKVKFVISTSLDPLPSSKYTSCCFLLLLGVRLVEFDMRRGNPSPSWATPLTLGWHWSVAQCGTPCGSSKVVNSFTLQRRSL